MLDRTLEDVSNIVHFEHVNVTQPDQRLATLFYVSGLGFTRDPYLMVGVDNMWINIGRNQMHLPTGTPQRLRGTIGLVVADLASLKQRLNDVAEDLSHTEFRFTDHDAFVEATCPWGNRFRCHAPGPEFGQMRLGIAYVEFTAYPQTAERIAMFYRDVMKAAAGLTSRDGAPTAWVRAGKEQHLFFKETAGPVAAYDGHHVQIYLLDFSSPYRQLLERGLISRDVDPHEWRFRDIVDLETNEVLFTLEHEVRSLKHPLYARPLVNRNPVQNNRTYMSGMDAFTSY